MSSTLILTAAELTRAVCRAEPEKVLGATKPLTDAQARAAAMHDADFIVLEDGVCKSFRGLVSEFAISGHIFAPSSCGDWFLKKSVHTLQGIALRY